MVIESLIDPLKAEKKPWELFFLGAIFTSIALFLSLWIFEQHASLILVFLTVLACVPLIYNTIKLEEKKTMILDSERTLLKEHSKALFFLLMLFAGITIAIALWYVVLPSNTVSNLFNVQQQTISMINGKATANAVAQFQVFTKIFFNNMKVLTFCLLFAFIYGVGGIFILTWNASVIGVAIGNVIRSNLAQVVGTTGFTKAFTYFNVASYGILRYFIHGIPEIAAYFVGGMAGSIISIAIIRHDFMNKKFEHIVLDSTDLIIISVLFLVIAAFIEVYITPVLF